MVNSIQENDIVLLIASGILIMVLLALAFIVFFNLSQKKIYQEKMNAQSLQLQHQEELLHSTLMTQEEERRRIAKDLHDDIGSKLNVINLNLHRVKQLGKESEALKETVREIQELIATTIQTTRRISHDLLPPVLDQFGLVAALEELSEQLNRSDDLEVSFEVSGSQYQPEDNTVKLNIFRIIQELINNSIRHGEASRIAIQLMLKQNGLQLFYKDNGKGFDSSTIEEKKGLGLRNIDSRVRMIGAQISFDSAVGKGLETTMELDVASAVV